MRSLLFLTLAACTLPGFALAIFLLRYPWADDRWPKVSQPTQENKQVVGFREAALQFRILGVKFNVAPLNSLCQRICVYWIFLSLLGYLLASAVLVFWHV